MQMENCDDVLRPYSTARAVLAGQLAMRAEGSGDICGRCAHGTGDAPMRFAHGYMATAANERERGSWSHARQRRAVA